jgi:hypothetical protein
MRLRTAAISTAVCAAMVSTASADPTFRAGLTLGLHDDVAPEANVVGPVAGLGYRWSALQLEADYAWLSFQDMATVHGGVHRVGVLARVELLRHVRPATGEGHALYAEVGVGERLGRWEIDATHVAPASGEQKEAHLGLGLSIDNRSRSPGYGWLLGVRFVVSPHDASFDAVCRGTCPDGDSSSTSSGTDKAVLLEASVVIGR